MSCGVGRRHGLVLVLLWLWGKPVAAAPIRPLAWEPPYTAGAVQEMAPKKKKILIGSSLTQTKNDTLCSSETVPMEIK